MLKKELIRDEVNITSLASICISKIKYQISKNKSDLNDYIYSPVLYYIVHVYVLVYLWVYIVIIQLILLLPYMCV